MVMTGSGTTITWTNGWSVHGRILPFLEQGPTFNAHQLHVSGTSTPENSTVILAEPVVLPLPERGQPDPKVSATATASGVNNYGWNMGDWYVWGGFAGPPNRAAFGSTGAAGSPSSPTA